MITMSRLFRHALQKPWPETSACRDPMSFVTMPRAVGAHARPDDLTRSRLGRRGEPYYPLGAGGGPPCFYSYLPPPHPLRIFQTVPPLCQTSRDHRRMMIVILRMIVPATGRVG